METHSSTLAWKIPWKEEPGGLQSTGLRRVRHDWAASLSLFTCMHRRRKWQPAPVFLPGEPQGRGAWWAAVYGVAQSWTRLKRLSSSSMVTSYDKYLTWVISMKQPFMMGFQWPSDYFTNEETEIQRDAVMPQSHAVNTTEPGFIPSSLLFIRLYIYYIRSWLLRVLK